MNKLLLSLLSGFVLLTGCRLDPPVIPGDVIYASPVLSDTYQPSTTNTTWVYQNFLLNQFAGESTNRITGNTFTINGKLYYEMESLNGADKELNYYSKTNGVYTYKEKPSVDPTDKEFEYSRENAAVGETWTNNFIDDPQTGAKQRGITKVIEKNFTKTVLGKAYAGVIHTQIDIQSDGGTGFASEGKIDFYVARGIGIIQIDSELLGLKASSQLKSYSIK